MVTVIVRHGTRTGVQYSISPTTATDLLAAVASSRHFGPGGSLECGMFIVSTSHELKEGMVLTWYPVVEAAAAVGEAAGPGAASGLGEGPSAVVRDVEALKSSMRDLRQQLERSKLSVTDSHAVGVYVINELSKIDIMAIQARLGIPLPGSELVELLQPQEPLFSAAETAMDESTVQRLFTAVASVLCERHGSVLHACDTSTAGYPMNPCHKIDLIISSSPRPHIGQVLWSTVTIVAELKPTISSSHSHLEATGQMTDRVQEVLCQQSQRTWCFGFVGGRCELEVMLFLKDPATKSIAVKRTGVLPFSLRADSPGLLILDALLSSSPSSLGFQSPPLESSFDITPRRDAAASWEIKFADVLQPDLRKTGSAVYGCHCRMVGAPSSELRAVLKAGPGSHDEARMIERLNSAGIQGVPTLWHTGVMPGSQRPYFIITPYGIPMSFSSSGKEMLSLVRDVAITVTQLYSTCEVLHLDISPKNIVTVDGGKGLLIDFHLACSCSQLTNLRAFTGTLEYMSLARLDGSPPSLSGELESLLYCLLFWACEGQLHWRHGMGVAAMAALKYDAMHRLFETKMMDRCRKPELKPAIHALRNLFFTPSYRKDIEPAAFILACERNMPCGVVQCV